MGRRLEINTVQCETLPYGERGDVWQLGPVLTLAEPLVIPSTFMILCITVWCVYEPFVCKLKELQNQWL